MERGAVLARELRETNMEKLKTTQWDSAEYLKTNEDIALYLEACLEENDPALIMHAFGVIARARETEKQRGQH